MMVVPCVAIGGITVRELRASVDAGADFLAVASGVGTTRTAAAPMKAFNACFAR
jgi:thiamine-phosphate pyrophosphorylase